jgi:ribosomal protein L37E
MPITPGAGKLYCIARRAGISKKVNPHNFRHSRASYLANFLTEAQMKEHFGWMQDSKMAAIYVHLSGRNVDSALLKVYGIETNGQKQESILKPQDCLRCGERNQVTNKFCQKCGMPLDQAVISDIVQKDLERREADKVLDGLLQDDEFREVLVRKISNLGYAKN